MIEVFKTNVQQRGDAEELVILLLHHFPSARINFDLQDCDNILRVEGNDFAAEAIMQLVSQNGFICHLLE